MALTYVKASGIDNTGSYTMGNLTVSANLSVANVNITGATTFSNISLAGNIIPTAANTYSLGSATYYFKDAYIGPGSLYIDGQKVMQSVSNTIVVSADLNQTLKLSTSGSGDIQIDPTGTGVIAIKGPMQIEAGSNITSSDGSAIRFTNSVSVDTITSVTTNTDLTLSGAGTGAVKVNDDLVVTGNITVQGSTGNLSVGTLSVEDNIIDISAETTGTPSNNAGLRVVRGDSPATQLRWYETGAVWQITNDGTNYLTIVGKDANGNISVGNITGTLVTGAQPNITSLGTLSSLTSGLITATTGGIKVGNIQDPSGTNTISLSSGNITVTSNVTATYFIGNGSSLTGQVGNALVAGTVYTNAQPNITSVGTLSTLVTSGNITSGVGTGTSPQLLYINANTSQYAATLVQRAGTERWLYGIDNTSANGNFVVRFNAITNYLTIDTTGVATFAGNITSGNANLGNLITANYHQGTLTTGAQPNITSVGTLTTLTSGTHTLSANANIAMSGSLSQIAGGNLVSANYFTGNGSLLTGIASATSAATVTTNAQPNITSVGTLASLNVSGNITSSSDLYVGSGAASTSFTNPIGIFKDTGTTYVQVAIVNSSNTGSADITAYGDNGTDVNGWVDMGFTGSNFSDANYTITGKNDGYIFANGVTGNSSFGGNLVFATGSGGANNDIVFATGGFLSGNEKIRFSHSLGTLNVKTTTSATSSTTGAIVSSGGIGAAGNVFSGALLFGNNTSELKAAPTISAGTLTIDLNSGTIFDVALNAAITTLTISNVQSSGRTSSFVLVFTADGTARAVTWPASFRWTAGNTAPTLTSTSTKRDVFTFFTIDGGTSWQAFISGQNI